MKSAAMDGRFWIGRRNSLLEFTIGLQVAAIPDGSHKKRPRRARPFPLFHGLIVAGQAGSRLKASWMRA